jgi:hypothetical protein
MIPEGDRVEGSMEFITFKPIFQTLAKNGATSDKIYWNGSYYRESVGARIMNGFYNAILTRMLGE